jgi:hypothetical protein
MENRTLRHKTKGYVGKGNTKNPNYQLLGLKNNLHWAQFVEYQQIILMVNKFKP